MILSAIQESMYGVRFGRSAAGISALVLEFWYMY